MDRSPPRLPGGRLAANSPVMRRRNPWALPAGPSLCTARSGLPSETLPSSAHSDLLPLRVQAARPSAGAAVRRAGPVRTPMGNYAPACSAGVRGCPTRRTRVPARRQRGSGAARQGLNATSGWENPHDKEPRAPPRRALLRRAALPLPGPRRRALLPRAALPLPWPRRRKKGRARGAGGGHALWT